MPRSLHRVHEGSHTTSCVVLEAPAAHEALRPGGRPVVRSCIRRIDVIFNRGLHEYLTEFLARTAAAGQ
jgi:hypothetical protein